MPLKITQQPLSIAASNGDNYYIVTSSQYIASSSLFVDYKYVANVCDTTGSVLVTLKSFPDPTYKYGLFNLRNISSAFTSYDFFPTSSTTTVFYTASNSSKKLQLYFGEEYSQPLSGSTGLSVFVTASNLASSSLIPFINSALSWKNRASDLSSFIMNGEVDGSKTFLQDYPYVSTPFKANQTLKQWLYYYTNASKVALTTINTYDITGSLLGTYTQNNPYYTTEGIQAIAVGYPQLNALITSSYTASVGTKPMITSNVYSYTVSIGTGTGDSTQKLKYVIDRSCSKYSQYNVYWLGEFGNFDSWVFNKKSEEKSNKTSSGYKKIYGNLTSAGGYTVNSYDRNQQDFYVSSTDSITLSTDFLSDNEVVFLKGLFNSPVIFIEDSSGNLYAANLKDDSYTLNKKVNNRIYSLTINLEYSYTNNRQLL